VRKFQPSSFGVTGRAATVKSDRSQQSESTLEHDFLTLLEYDRRVEQYASQPITLRWRDAEGRHRYTPDVVVSYTDIAVRSDPTLRTTLFEVKYRSELKEKWAEFKPKFKAAIAWTRDADMRFRIITEREIRTPYLENARFLLGYRSKRMPKNAGLNGEIQERIRVTLYRLQRTTPQELLAAMTPVEHYQAEFLPWIWYLINCNAIGCDLHKPLNMVSAIWSLDSEFSLGRRT
jgi:hypothetical protein